MRRLDLSGHKNEYGRPRLRFEIDKDCYNEDCSIVIHVMEAMGHPGIYIELTPDEARLIANHLRELAHQLEEVSDE